MITTPKEIIKYGSFLARDNRFVATILIDQLPQKAHVPNSGRMKELLTEGTPVALIEKKGDHRKTKFQLAWVQTDSGWVNIDSANPNKIVAKGIKADIIPEFAQYELAKTEVTVGKSRLDLLLRHKESGNLLFIETKSVTLVEEKVAMFPDAPTTRGVKHMEQLSLLALEGQEAAVVFLIQRNDAIMFRPNDKTDKSFGRALRNAHADGVKVYAFTCRVEPGVIMLNRSVPVALN